MANDTKNKKKKEKINIRSYINYALLMIAIVLVAFIACKLYNTYQDNKLSSSVFSRMVGNIQYADIENTISELSSDGFIFISYTKNKDVKKLETSLKKSIVSHELQNDFLYMDATELMLEDGYIDTLNKKFHLEGSNAIKELPAILYYKDGELKKVLTSTKDRMLTTDDFNKMLDSYEIVDK